MRLKYQTRLFWCLKLYYSNWNIEQSSFIIWNCSLQLNVVMLQKVFKKFFGIPATPVGGLTLSPKPQGWIFANAFFMSDQSKFCYLHHCTWWCTYIMKYFILWIILSLEIKFLSIVILYPHKVFHQQISTFTTTEIFFRISNLIHANAKL